MRTLFVGGPCDGQVRDVPAGVVELGSTVAPTPWPIDTTFDEYETLPRPCHRYAVRPATGAELVRGFEAVASC